MASGIDILVSLSEMLGADQSGDSRKPGPVEFVRLCMASGIDIFVSLSEMLGVDQSGDSRKPGLVEFVRLCMASGIRLWDPRGALGSS